MITFFTNIFVETMVTNYDEDMTLFIKEILQQGEDFP